MASKKKVLLIAGHGEGDPGACSKWGYEADYTRELTKLVSQCLSGKLNVDVYDMDKNCYAQSKRGNVPTYSNYDFTLEIHFNAKAKKDPYGDGKQTGCGGYIHPDNGGRAIARAILDGIVGLGLKEWLLDNSTGLLNLNRAQAQGAKYFLLETAFIDDGDDMKWYTANREKVAGAVAQGILSGLGLKSTAGAAKTSDEYFRVRTAWEDAKSQIFAGTKEGAIRACVPGMSVFDPEGKYIFTKEVKGLLASSMKGVSEAEYIEKVLPLYVEEEKRTGILACVSLAQSILESGYGQTDLAQNANNMHGMKCSLSANVWKDTAWDGDRVYTKMSPEEIDGKMEMLPATFRVYDCIEDSIRDHSAYLLNAPNGSARRYAGIETEKDVRKAAQIIKSGGYATDSGYVDKIVDIVKRWDLEARCKDGCSDQPEQAQVSAAPSVPYLIETRIDLLRVRSMPKKKSRVTMTIMEPDDKKNKYTIVEERDGWGRLKSGAGWVKLKYVKKV